MKIKLKIMGKTIKKAPTPTPSINEESVPKTKKEIITSIIRKKSRQKFLSENQKKFYNDLTNNQISICTGPAGVGKSYITIRAAIDLLVDENNEFEKIIIVRPAVESSDSKLGFLPGDLREKMDPYVYASLYLFNKIIGQDATKKLESLGVLEIMSLSYMRGINIDNSILIFEEAQNSTQSEMKMVLTRIGFNSKFFISGDVEQSDKFKVKEHSGLFDAMTRLKGIPDISVFEFENSDVVRNELISVILSRY